MPGAPHFHARNFLSRVGFSALSSIARHLRAPRPPVWELACHCQLPSTRGVRIELSRVDARLRSSLGRRRGACHRCDGRRLRHVHVRGHRASACSRRNLEQPLVPLVVLCGHLLYKQLDLRRLRSCRLLDRRLCHNDIPARSAGPSACPAQPASGPSRAIALMLARTGTPALWPCIGPGPTVRQ